MWEAGKRLALWGRSGKAEPLGSSAAFRLGLQIAGSSSTSFIPWVPAQSSQYAPHLTPLLAPSGPPGWVRTGVVFRICSSRRRCFRLFAQHSEGLAFCPAPFARHPLPDPEAAVTAVPYSGTVLLGLASVAERFQTTLAPTRWKFESLLREQ